MELCNTFLLTKLSFVDGQWCVCVCVFACVCCVCVHACVNVFVKQLSQQAETGKSPRMGCYSPLSRH